MKDLTLEQRLARVEAALGLTSSPENPNHAFTSGLTPLTNLVPLRLALTFDRANRERKISFPTGRFSSLRDALTLQLYGSLGDAEVTDAEIEVQVDGLVVKPSTSPLFVIHERDDTDSAGTWRVLSVSVADSVDLAEKKELNLVILPWPTDEAMTKRILTAIDRNTRAIASHDHNTTYAGIDHRHEGTYQPKGNYQPKGDYATQDHNHEGVYQPKGDYAGTNHTHEGSYQPKGDYAGANHTHEGVYQPKGDYSPVNHSHDSRYATLSHLHDNYKIPISTNEGMDGFLTSISAAEGSDNGSLRLGFQVIKNGEYYDSLTIECVMKYVGYE